jgi:hypothetical protein
MSTIDRTRRALLGAALAQSVIALALLPSPAAATKNPVPRFVTGGVSHATATTGELDGTVSPEGYAVGYFFEYGPTIAYGAHTKQAALPVTTATKPVKVGQIVTGLLPGYHYRIVGVYTNKAGTPVTAPGTDRSFTGGKASLLGFVLPKSKEEQISIVYGSTAELSGSLTGSKSAGQPLSLQGAPFPFKTAFTTLGAPVVSSRTGSFLFKIARLTQNTEVRVLTLSPRPIYSPTIIIHVTPRISLRVRSAGSTGLYRLFGTVAPARTGMPVQIQELLPQPQGSQKSGPRPHAVATAILKRATSTLSRFSIVVRLSGTFRYRAYVKLPKGAMNSGYSSNVLIRAPRSTRHKKK